MRLIDADKLCEDLLKRWEIADKQKEKIIQAVMSDVVTPIVVCQPTVTSEPQWIPCSERLPEVGTYVLVSKKALGFRSNLPNVCTAHRSRDPRSGKEEWNDMLFGKLDDDDVFAWMPLPSAYREEGD